MRFGTREATTSSSARRLSAPGSRATMPSSTSASDHRASAASRVVRQVGTRHHQRLPAVDRRCAIARPSRSHVGRPSSSPTTTGRMLAPGKQHLHERARGLRWSARSRVRRGVETDGGVGRDQRPAASASTADHAQGRTERAPRGTPTSRRPRHACDWSRAARRGPRRRPAPARTHRRQSGRSRHSPRAAPRAPAALRLAAAGPGRAAQEGRDGEAECGRLVGVEPAGDRGLAHAVGNAVAAPRAK